MTVSAHQRSTFERPSGDQIARTLADGEPASAWQRTYSGGKWWPLEPRACDVDLIDIAHHLSMQTRYAGATRIFYSVAEHCWHVSRIVPPELALQGLLHDAAEFCLTDLPRPVKRDDAAYMAHERLNNAVILPHFGLPAEMHPTVADADHAMCLAESDQLFHAPVLIRDVLPPHILRAPTVELQGWSWEEARERFLLRFEEITGESRDAWRGASPRTI